MKALTLFGVTISSKELTSLDFQINTQGNTYGPYEDYHHCWWLTDTAYIDAWIDDPEGARRLFSGHKIFWPGPFKSRAEVEALQVALRMLWS